MKIDALLQQVTEEAPCGPDLKASRDSRFVEIFSASAGRLPNAYLVQGEPLESTDFVLPPRDEMQALDGLLADSRDLRFLVLQARWAAISQNLQEFSNAIAACRALLEKFDIHLHPLKAHDRKRFLSGLSDGETIYRPLQYLDLTGTTNVTLKTLSDADERPVLIRELGMAAHNRTVFKTYELIKGVQADLTEIRNACLSSETAKCEPDFSLVMKALAAISDAIEEARPDFVAVVSEPDDQSDNLAEVGGSSADIAVGKHPGQLINVNNHDHARALLKACMAYYAHSEPSSPVLLLLIEAERLIGAPLVKAVAALMPQNMETITVRLGDSGFALNASRLAELTKLISEGHEAGTGIQGDTLAGSDAAREAPGTGASSSDPGPVVINTRDNALTAIASVELWFTTVEASSPVPLLLSKAQSYASKNFQSIIADLITNSTETA